MCEDERAQRSSTEERNTEMFFMDSVKSGGRLRVKQVLSQQVWKAESGDDGAAAKSPCREAPDGGDRVPGAGVCLCVCVMST